MKTTRSSAPSNATKAAAAFQFQGLSRRLTSLVLLTGTFILCAVPKPALGNLFVVDSFSNNGTIGEYTNSGATVDATLITGLNFPAPMFNGPRSIAVSDGFLYVTNPVAGTVGKYTTSGATINASLISGLNAPRDIEVSEGDLYVAESQAGRVGKYTTSGATINASLISGLPFPEALALSGTNLFVGDGANGTVGEYATSGATVNAALITGLNAGDMKDVEVSGSSLFVARGFGDSGDLVGKYNVDGTAIDPFLIPPLDRERNGLAIFGTDLFFVGDDRVSKYTTSGTLLADPLITGLASGFGIAIDGPTTVPETLSTLWFGLATTGLLGFARLLRNSRALVPASR